jgi:hypothetical protein
VLHIAVTTWTGGTRTRSNARVDLGSGIGVDWDLLCVWVVSLSLWVGALIARTRTEEGSAVGVVVAVVLGFFQKLFHVEAVENKKEERKWKVGVMQFRAD